MNSGKRSNQQNVDNMELFTERVVAFQPGYDPAETRLSIPNQKQIKARGDEVLLGVNTAESACNNSVSARTDAFNTLDSLVTRALNALRISDVSEQTIEQGASIVREMRNKRASQITPPATVAEGTQPAEPVKTNKMHSGSYDTKIENFRRFIVLLGTIAAYKPKEPDLTVDSLNVKLAALILVNSAVKTADARANAARTERDAVLYAAKTGLVEIAFDSKLYVKSAYGIKSSQYKSIGGILFTRKKLSDGTLPELVPDFSLFFYLN